MNRISEKINRVVRSLGTPPELEMSDKEIEQSYQGYKIEDFSWKSQDSGGFRIEFPQETAEGDEGWYDNFLYYSDGSIGFKHWYPEGMYRELVEFVESRDDRPIKEAGRTAKAPEWIIYNPKENLFWSNRDGWVDKDSATVFLDDEKDRYSHIPGVGSKWVPVDFKPKRKSSSTRGVPSTYDIAEVLLADAVAVEIEYCVEDGLIERAPWPMGSELTGWMASEIEDWDKHVNQVYQENRQEIDGALNVIEEEEKTGWEKESWAGSWVVYVVNVMALEEVGYDEALDVVDKTWPELNRSKEGFVKRTPGKERY